MKASDKQQRLAEPQPWERDEPGGYTLPPTSFYQAGVERLNAAATPARMRQFPSGATRNTDDDKIDPQGFIHPLVTHAYCTYMHKHRLQADGQLRESGNWKRGIPRAAYAASLSRHHLDVDLLLSGCEKEATTPDLLEALCAMYFNVQGLMLEVLLQREPK